MLPEREEPYQLCRGGTCTAYLKRTDKLLKCPKRSDKSNKRVRVTKLSFWPKYPASTTSYLTTALSRSAASNNVTSQACLLSTTDRYSVRPANYYRSRARSAQRATLVTSTPVRPSIVRAKMLRRNTYHIVWPMAELAPYHKSSLLYSADHR